MQNPQNYSSHNEIPMSTLYQYKNGDNIKWLQKQYKTPRLYLDPLEQAQQRKYAQQKKGEKDKRYVTKRGFYMDYDLKIAKAIPSAVDHGKNQPWDVQNMKQKSKHRKVDQKLIKYTYIDQIQINQQKRKSPGVCAYSLQKSLKEKEKLIQLEKNRKKVEEERKFFHFDIEHLGNTVPGVGNYNPHDEIEKNKKNKTDWKFWVDKHKKFQELIRKRDEIKPNSCSYNPMNTTITTFDKINSSPKASKVPGFGTSERFSYSKVEKKKIKQIRPSPATYNTVVQWRSKSLGPKFKPWDTAIWKGRNYNTISIYE